MRLFKYIQMKENFQFVFEGSKSNGNDNDGNEENEEEKHLISSISFRFNSFETIAQSTKRERIEKKCAGEKQEVFALALALRTRENNLFSFVVFVFSIVSCAFFFHIQFSVRSFSSLFWLADFDIQFFCAKFVRLSFIRWLVFLLFFYFVLFTVVSSKCTQFFFYSISFILCSVRMDDRDDIEVNFRIDSGSLNLSN